jgi:hypothetical protein
MSFRLNKNHQEAIELSSLLGKTSRVTAANQKRKRREANFAHIAGCIVFYHVYCLPTHGLQFVASCLFSLLG